MRVELCRIASEWDAYVEAHPQAVNYHRWIWKKLIEDTYGHETFYLMVRGEEGIQGVLPLVAIKSWIFGRFLVSVPFFSYGGLLASSAEAREQLLQGAVKLARELGARHIELRQGTVCEVSWQDTTAKVTMEVTLPEDVALLWDRLSSGLRNKVRKAQRCGLRTEWGKSDAVDVFYTLFAKNMRDLGTPVYPRRWFENFFRLLPNETRILTVWDQAQPVAAGFVTSFRDTLELPWSASLPNSRKKYSAVLLYWSLQEWALENGYRRVDFGRCTPGSGTHEFKRHWGCHEKPLHWYYWLPNGAPVPELRPANPHFHLAIGLWKHLPIGVANLLGPRIVRAIP